MKDKQEKILNYIKDKEEKMVFAHLLDLSRNNEKDTSSHFISSDLIAIFGQYLKSLGINYQVYYPNLLAVKGIIYFGDNYFVTHYRGKNVGLRHQDILGSLFAAGLENEMFGDIFVEKDYFYFSIIPKVEKIVESIHVMGNKKIELEKISEIVLKEDHLFPLVLSLASTRLDVVVSRLSGVSRVKVVQILKNQEVRVNQMVEKRKDFLLEEGFSLSIRHVGRFKVGLIEKSKRKDRYFVTIYQYK